MIAEGLQWLQENLLDATVTRINETDYATLALGGQCLDSYDPEHRVKLTSVVHPENASFFTLDSLVDYIDHDSTLDRTELWLHVHSPELVRLKGLPAYDGRRDTFAGSRSITRSDSKTSRTI